MPINTRWLLLRKLHLKSRLSPEPTITSRKKKLKLLAQTLLSSLQNSPKKP
jgi:hypothetical protein